MIRVVTDTTTSLTLDDYKQYGITPVPLYVREGDITKKEMLEISYDEFYQRQRAGTKFSTSQPDPNSFVEVFKPAVEAGDEVICVTLSGKISGTINSANLATQILETDKVSIIDSCQSGYGQSLMAVRAARMAKEGAGRAEIVKTLEGMIPRSRTFFCVESLKYLYEGGRLSGAQALIGSMIQIKPVIWFTGDGTMEPKEKIRTLKAAKARVLELVRERVSLGIEEAGLHYGDNLEEAQGYAKEMEEIVGMPVKLVKLSPVLGSHTGPDLLGPFVLTKK